MFLQLCQLDMVNGLYFELFATAMMIKFIKENVPIQ